MDSFFCVLYDHFLLVQDVILTLVNFNGLVYLCPIWSCFASAGRHTPLIEFQWTCSFVSYMVIFCYCRTLHSHHRTPKDLFFCVLCGQVLIEQDVMLASWNFKGLVLLCLIWLCFARAGRFAPLMELQRTCSLCPIWSCFVVQDVMLTS